MHNSSAMRKLHGPRNCLHKLRRIPRPNWTFFKPVTQRASSHVLEHQVGSRMVQTDLINAHDVRVLKSGEGFRFDLEPHEVAAQKLSSSRTDQLQCHEPLCHLDLARTYDL